MKTIAEVVRFGKNLPFENETTLRFEVFLKVLVTLFIVTSGVLSSQTRTNRIRPGFNLECVSSGNGHGLFYAPGLQFTKGRNTFGAEILVHKRTMEAGGARIYYQANLTGEPCGTEIASCDRDLIQVNAFSYLHYNQPMSLSFYGVKEANTWVGDRQPNWENTRFSTIEGGAGFQVQYNITQKTALNLSFASSYYYHPVYTEGLFFEKKGPGLFLALGLQTHL